MGCCAQRASDCDHLPSPARPPPAAAGLCAPQLLLAGSCLAPPGSPRSARTGWRRRPHSQRQLLLKRDQTVHHGLNGGLLLQGHEGKEGAIRRAPITTAPDACGPAAGPRLLAHQLLLTLTVRAPPLISTAGRSRQAHDVGWGSGVEGGPRRQLQAAASERLSAAGPPSTHSSRRPRSGSCPTRAPRPSICPSPPGPSPPSSPAGRATLPWCCRVSAGDGWIGAGD